MPPGLQNEGLLGNAVRAPTFIQRFTADTGAITAGDAISIDCDDTTYGVGNSVTESDPATDSEDANTCIGVLQETVTANSNGQFLKIQTGGFCADVNVESTVKKGDLLIPGTTKGRLARYQRAYEAFIDGGAAGALTTGISNMAAEDVLIAVYEEDTTSGKLTDLTSEFSITAANTIDNTGGTATSSDKLIVKWEKRVNAVALALADASSNAADCILLNPYDLDDGQ